MLTLHYLVATPKPKASRKIYRPNEATTAERKILISIIVALIFWCFEKESKA
jgi:hypothetical protein